MEMDDSTPLDTSNVSQEEIVQDENSVSFDMDGEALEDSHVSQSDTVLPDGQTVDITPEQQARIDRLVEVLEEATHYELLEVGHESPARSVKRAYYRLSREFHPDRFYRKNLGPYKLKLEQVFARINLAYRVLSDDALRADYDAELAGVDANATGQISMATHEVAIGFDPAAKKNAPKQARLKKKKAPLPPFMVKARKEIAKRLKQARKAYLVGKRHFDEGEFATAATVLQRAMLLDPKNEDARSLYKRAQNKSRNVKAEEHWREGQDSLKREEFQQAAAHFKLAVECQPTTGKYYMSFGKVIWEHTMRHRAAIELYRTAVEKEPKNLEYLLVLASAYENVGMPNNALKALERATQIDPGDPEVKKALKRLR
jgi:tetratricopeptide (TPR) repeat protein